MMRQYMLHRQMVTRNAHKVSEGTLFNYQLQVMAVCMNSKRFSFYCSTFKISFFRHARRSACVRVCMCFYLDENK